MLHHSADLLAVRGVTHLVVHGTSGSTTVQSESCTGTIYGPRPHSIPVTLSPSPPNPHHLHPHSQSVINWTVVGQLS